MQGLMMQWPLVLTHFLDRARRLHHRRPIASRHAAGVFRYSFGEWAARVERLAGALAALGIRRGDRVATFGWNSYRHYEAYFAIPCMGAVLHTMNVRLFPEQLAWVLNHAGDRAVLVDASLLPLFEKIRPELTTVEHVIVMGDAGSIPNGYLDYETLLAAAPERFAWPALEEEEAAALCYTSGTTGHPKGVLYSHRALVLHTLGISLADAFQIRERDVLLAIVPMFHANAWGLPFAAAMLGCAVVLPGPHLQPKELADLIESEGVTFIGGVPTIVTALYQHLKQAGRRPATLRQIIVGGSALPQVLLEGFERDLGVEVVHAWGMTELSPAGSVSRLRAEMESWPKEEQTRVRLLQGSPFPLVELRVVREDGSEAPWDGVTAGELQARGPWVVRQYYNDPGSAERFDGEWFRTGDVATIDALGFVRLVDRTKDMVKSGGEWISSVDLENAIMGHPQVAEAAVVAIAHPKWTERPLACVVPRQGGGGELSRESIRAFLKGRVADWWLPDDVVVLDAVPKTSVGKFDKKVLRERFKDYVWPEVS
ncbi:MAG TPA: long-chain fatty acid--CoA ligase [Gemmatimonadales bacterium]|jgi:fatty-acyl-CoA synthase|nr:long-chain fatty acid--CoA ligase [Gemmatimonadales bacterium]